MWRWRLAFEQSVYAIITIGCQISSANLEKKPLFQLSVKTHGRPEVGWRRILHADPEKLPGILSLPPDSLVQWVLHPYRALYRTMLNAIPAEPALIGVEHYGWFALFRVGHEDIGPAYVYARVASPAQFRIDDNTPARCHWIRHEIGSIIHHHYAPIPCRVF